MTRLRAIAWLIPFMLMCVGVAHGQQQFHLIEATIDGIHTELRAGRLSCTQVVQAYLNRIKAYDQSGPMLNAVQNVNPGALKQAADLDARLRTSGTLAGTLHCIPVLIKDQFDTNFMPTTYGSALFKTFVPHTTPPSSTVCRSGRYHPRQDQHGRVRLCLFGLRIR